MKNTFEDIKCRVLELIEINRQREVSRKTDYRKAGVYMLYVDCFTDDSIIPFYIGQTDDFQARHKKHLTDLLALNRLDQDAYEYALLKELYNGRYRPCKIFSYMVNHGCTLNDFHMVILEEIDDDTQRLDRETEYINSLCAPFFGFNQMNCVSKMRDLLYGYSGKAEKEEYARIVADDYNNLVQYSQFGYALFNWYLMHGIFGDERIEEFLTSVSDSRFGQIIQDRRRLNEVQTERQRIKQYYCVQAENDVWEICQETVKDFFSKHGLRSKDKQRLIIRSCLFDIESVSKDLEAYFRRYKDRIHEDIFDVLKEKHGEIIKQTKAKIEASQEKYWDLEKEETQLLKEKFSTLLPSKEYKSHPLKSIYDGFAFVRKKKEDNVCYVNIEFTCFKDDFLNGVYPEICKIDYLVVRNGKEQGRSAFIQNSMMEFFDTDEVYYCESGPRSGPFNPYLEGDIGTYISVAMEYKNGINEHTLLGKTGEDDAKILKEIDGLIDDSTKIIYSTSGYKTSIKRFADIGKYKNIKVLKRIAQQCR